MIRVSIETEEGYVQLERKEGYDGTWNSILPVIFDALKGLGFCFRDGKELEIVDYGETTEEEYIEQ